MSSRDASAWPGRAVFCPHCGTQLEMRAIHGAERGVCPGCGRIEFRTPSIGVAVVVRDQEGRILLVRRGPEVTQPGRWSIPAGYLDYGEDVRVGAARELREETGLDAEIGDPVYVASNFHDPAKLTVGIWFEGTVTGGRLEAGDDAVEAEWFALDDLPDMAFETDIGYLAGLVDC